MSGLWIAKHQFDRRTRFKLFERMRIVDMESRNPYLHQILTFSRHSSRPSTFRSATMIPYSGDSEQPRAVEQLTNSTSYSKKQLIFPCLRNGNRYISPPLLSHSLLLGIAHTQTHSGHPVGVGTSASSNIQVDLVSANQLCESDISLLAPASYFNFSHTLNLLLLCCYVYDLLRAW